MLLYSCCLLLVLMFISLFDGFVDGFFVVCFFELFLLCFFFTGFRQGMPCLYSFGVLWYMTMNSRAILVCMDISSFNSSIISQSLGSFS